MPSFHPHARVQVANLMPVLFNGLGSHITMIPEKNLTIYLKVCVSSVLCAAVHLLFESDWMVQFLGVFQLHCLC